ncbi:MAG TPA: hypothetical protein VF054_12820 [Micromonosporaceae bacterium]
MAASSARTASSLAAARHSHARLAAAVHNLDRALAMPAVEPTWTTRVRGALNALRPAFALHVDTTEGPDGLHGEILDREPRLAHQATVLVREHAVIAATMDALAERLGTVPPDLIRAWAVDLLRELSRHRQRGADLLYEAFETDIGGEN